MSDLTPTESRRFDPPQAFAAQAHIASLKQYQDMHARSLAEPEAFWAEIAQELTWTQPWQRVLNADDAPFYRWFEGGKTNITLNCLDRHVDSGLGDKTAIFWEGEPGDTLTLSYAELLVEVCRFANVLKHLGVKKGDSVAIYLPMIPELAIAVLACARIGAVHSVIFAGFSAESVRDRVLDASSKCVITADGAWRRGKELLLKNIVDDGIKDCACVESVLVVQRHPDKEPFGHTWQKDRDHWYHKLKPEVADTCPAEEMDAEDMLFLLYTSGSTGKPKGIMHTVGGYMVYTYLTAKLTFDLKAEDIYWCTADVGWITGHSYIVYGPMANAATQVMYEGAPNYPDEARFWDLVEKYRVSIFYTAPTAIRAFMKWGDAFPQKHDLSSLRLLGTVGEPINPEAWMWYHEIIGGGCCPIVDTWWQTETGGHMLTPLPGAITTKPGSATLPFFGVDAAVLDEAGNEVERGLLAIRKPWPSMLRGIWGDSERFKNTYWCKWNGQYYFPGDGAIKDTDGYIWVTGRVDDVVNVSGHRIGTAELESVCVAHPAVAESAVIGVPHEIKGQGLVAFVIIRTGAEGDEAGWRKELMTMVDEKIGKFARPEKIVFSADLPKTRSGKIMRRLLRDIAENRPLGNVTTLADPGIVEVIKEKYQQH
ncbi:MAG: acetate--CoA ligase [Verrucomicrobiota bacterium]